MMSDDNLFLISRILKWPNDSAESVERDKSGWMDGWTDGWMDGETDGRMERRMDGQMERRMDGAPMKEKALQKYKIIAMTTEIIHDE